MFAAGRKVSAMSAYNELIVRALYSTQLGRIPNEAELAHWVSVIETQGAACFAEHIFASAEAYAVRQKQVEHVARTSPERILYNIVRSDKYFSEIISQIVRAPITVAISSAASSVCPLSKVRRLTASPMIRIIDDTSISAPKIRICEIAELDDSQPSTEIFVSVVAFPELGAFLSTEWPRLCFAETARRRLLREPLPVGFNHDGVVNLGLADQKLFPERPAIVLKRRRCAPPTEEWATQLGAELCVHHYLSEEHSRCIASLDEWDQIMGTAFARRYREVAVQSVVSS